MKNSPPRSPRENRLPPMGEQPEERDQGAMHPRHHQPTTYPSSQVSQSLHL
jgi:hypothetical protein